MTDQPVPREVVLSSGDRLEVIRRLGGGRTNDVLLVRHSGRCLVLKVARRPGGSLSVEARALRILNEARFPAPILVTEAALDQPRLPCLLLSPIRGRAPRGAHEHELAGLLLAELHETPSRPALPEADAGDALGAARGVAQKLGTEDRRAVTAALAPLGEPWLDRVFAHGDASPENTLVTSDGPVFIDFERAREGPAGLDLGRFSFLVASGADVESPEPLVEAFRAGYAARRPLPRDLHSWTVLAGLLLAAWRLRWRAAPATPDWRAALELTRDLARRRPAS